MSSSETSTVVNMDLHSPAAEKVNSPVKEALLSTAVSDSAPSTTPGRDVAAEEDGTKTSSPKKGTAFWMIMVSIMITTFLSALDLTAVSTALPTIAYDLKSEDFTWIGSAYALSSTAFLPVFGGLAEVFGRKPNLLAAITIFAVGSAVCGSATSATAMIVGRTIQGVGGGGILTLVEIVIADLVPLAERGLYFGLLGLVWAISSAIGPVMGGALAASNWRWLFYLNIPLAVLSFGLVVIFLNLRIPEGSLGTKLRKVDWIGSLIFLGAATLLICGLTFGGTEFPWASAGTLAPLLIGVAGLFVFAFYERKFAKDSILPFQLFNITTIMGYLTTFLHGIISIAVFYYLPAWFQSVLGHGPVRSGVDIFPTAFLVAPFAIVVGISTTVTGKYKPQNIMAWVILAVGVGILTLIRASSSLAMALGIQVPLAVGLGMLYAAPNFAILAPLPPALNAPAMAFGAFTRSFGQVFGITIGSVVLTNQFGERLPQELISQLPGGVAAAYSAIPEIASLPEPLRSATRVAFSDSIRTIWFVLIGFAVAGFVCSLFIKALTLNATTDEQWGIKEKASEENASAASKV